MRSRASTPRCGPGTPAPSYSLDGRSPRACEPAPSSGAAASVPAGTVRSSRSTFLPAVIQGPPTLTLTPFPPEAHMTIHLSPADRRAVASGRKTAHLFAVLPKFVEGERHALWRPILDPLARDDDGRLVNVNDDGTPKASLDPCHVRILSITATPLGDLVKADARALGLERVVDIARAWMDAHDDGWRLRLGGEGDYLDSQVILDEFRDRWHSYCAWLVRWERNELDETTWLAQSSQFRYTTNPAVAVRDAGTIVPAEFQAQITAERRDNDERDRAAGRRHAAAQATAALTGLYASTALGMADRRIIRNSTRAITRQLEQVGS